jgi:hypothetical protein
MNTERQIQNLAVKVYGWKKSDNINKLYRWLCKAADIFYSQKHQELTSDDDLLYYLEFKIDSFFEDDKGNRVYIREDDSWKIYFELLEKGEYDE